MLAEARGCRLSLGMAHQHLGQLTPELREALAANARTRIYFQLRQGDAHQLAPDVSPELSEYDLANLARYMAAVRLCHDGQTGRPFTLTTEALPAAAPERAEEIKALAAERARNRSAEMSPKQPSAMPSKEFHRRHRYQPQQSADPGGTTLPICLPICPLICLPARAEYPCAEKDLKIPMFSSADTGGVI